jgi:hypothetical protein
MKLRWRLRCDVGCRLVLFLTLFLMPAELVEPSEAVQALLSGVVMLIGAAVRFAMVWLLLHLARNWQFLLLRGLWRFVSARLVNEGARLYIFLHPGMTKAKVERWKQVKMTATKEWLQSLWCWKCLVVLAGVIGAVFSSLFFVLWIVPRYLYEVVAWFLERIAQTGWGKAIAAGITMQNTAVAAYPRSAQEGQRLRQQQQRYQRRKRLIGIARWYRKKFHKEK